MKKLQERIQDIENKPVYDDATSQFSFLVNDNEINRIKDLVIPNLAIIEEEVDELFFSKIKKCKNINEAGVYSP